jgi:hypothetical protein
VASVFSVVYVKLKQHGHLGGTTDLLSAADSTAISYQPEAISKKLLGPSCEPRIRSGAWNWKAGNCERQADS